MLDPPQIMYECLTPIGHPPPGGTAQLGLGGYLAARLNDR